MPPMTPAQELAVQWLPWSRRVARIVHAKRTFIDLDDIAGEAAVALVEAANRYDPARGVAFVSFAWRAVFGACYDAIRRAAAAESADVEISDKTISAISKEIDPADAAEVAELVDRIRNGISREPFARASDSEMSGKAIARRRGCTEAGAGRYVRRARQLLDEIDSERAKCN
jgi:RNA polymerase sigma factor (sigma-70 family)